MSRVASSCKTSEKLVYTRDAKGHAPSQNRYFGQQSTIPHSSSKTCIRRVCFSLMRGTSGVAIGVVLTTYDSTRSTHHRLLFLCKTERSAFLESSLEILGLSLSATPFLVDLDVLHISHYSLDRTDNYDNDLYLSSLKPHARSKQLSGTWIMRAPSPHTNYLTVNHLPTFCFRSLDYGWRVCTYKR